MEEKKTTRQILDEFMSSDAYKNQEKLLEEKKKSIKTGDNVLHLEYLGELNDSDLSDINNKLQSAGLELSSFDKSGVMYNSLEEFSLVTFFVLNQPLVIELLKGIGTNALWDTIKFSVLSVRNQIKGKSYSKNTAGKIEEKQLKFGLQVNLDKNTGFNIELDGNVSDEVIESSLDKVLDFLKEQQPRDKYQIPDYVYYSEKEEKWIKLDVMEEISKKTKAKTKKKK